MPSPSCRTSRAQTSAFSLPRLNHTGRTWAGRAALRRKGSSPLSTRGEPSARPAQISSFASYCTSCVPVAKNAAVTRLVIEIPQQHALVRAELADNVADIALNLRPAVGIAHLIPPRARRRLAVVLAPVRAAFAGRGTARRRRSPQSSIRVSMVLNPRPSAMVKKPVDARHQPVAVMLPDDKRQVDAQGVVARLRRPAQFAVDGLGIEGLFLPDIGPVTAVDGK